MYIVALVLVSAVSIGILLYLSFKSLKTLTWFLSWLRGSFGLACLALCVMVLLLSYDLSDYSELLEQKPIASIHFEKTGEQHYTASISYYIDKKSETFEILGDQWQMDARIITWTGIISSLGAKPGFKLDRISGRYYSLEDERSKKRSVYSISSESYLLDAWKFINTYGQAIPGIEAKYGNATYLPMADKASYQVSLSSTGLTAVPTNTIAKNAVKMWR